MEWNSKFSTPSESIFLIYQIELISTLTSGDGCGD